MCRRLYLVYTQCPLYVVSEFLVGCWLDSYALRFTHGLRADAGIPALRPKFLPTSFPPSGSAIAQRRAATCDALSYFARFGVCTPALLGIAEQRLLDMPLCGNVCQLHGLFPADAPGLRPAHLACHTVPERLVRAIEARCMDDELRSIPEALHAPLRTMLATVESMVPSSARAKKMPRPPLGHLELLLRLILVHRASANSSQGFPLAMAVHRQSTPLVCFLLASGADPTLKQGIALQLAAKKGWLEGLKLLVERDDQLESKWRAHLNTLVDVLNELSALRNHVVPFPHPRRPPAGRTKRRRLSDRCQLDLQHLQAAVRSQAWGLVAYMMHGKGLVPDVETLHLMELHGMP